MRNFTGRVAAITGAGSGIGRALAYSLATRGAKLALADNDAAALDEVTAALSKRGATAMSQQLDVADRSQVFSWAQATREHFGAVHCIINNAGVSLHAPVSEMPIEDFQWLMNINFWGVVHGCQAFLPFLAERDGAGRAAEGHIVNVSSIFGIIAAPAQSAYNSAKFAVRGFSESLRMELELEGRPIGVTCVHPGGIDTNIVRTSRQRGSGPLSRQKQDLVAEFHGQLVRNSAEYCARRIMQGIEGNQPRVLVGLDAWLLDWVARHLPRGYQRLLVRELRRRLPSGSSS